MKSLSHAQLFASPRTVSVRLLHPWDSPGKITGVGCHFLFQGVFPTQGSNLGLLHYRQTLYHLSHKRASPLVSTISNLHSVSTVSRIKILFSELKSTLSLNHSKVGSYFPNISFKAGKTKTKTKTPDTIVKEKWNKHREI